MTPPVLLSVLNQSARVTDDEVQAMVAAVGKQLARDVAPVYGATPALEFVAKGQPFAGAPVYIVDQPDVAGALGYHDEGADGVPYVKVFVAPTLDNGGTVMTSPDSVSVTLSHEVLELLGDSPANKWADGPGGYDFAFELCDAVEADAYEIDGVFVSNFVLPAFFDPQAENGSKLDFLGKLGVPFTMTAGGYQIKRSEPGKTTQVFGRVVEPAPGLIVSFGPDFPEWKKAAKLEKAVRRRSRRPT